MPLISLSKKPILLVMLEKRLAALFHITVRIRELHVKGDPTWQQVQNKEFKPLAEETEELRQVHIGGPDSIWMN